MIRECSSSTDKNPFGGAGTYSSVIQLFKVLRNFEYTEKLISLTFVCKS